MKYCFIVLLGLLSFSKSHAQKTKTLNDSLAVFDAYVQKAMKDWSVPGIAIAIVKNDEIVLPKVMALENMAPIKGRQQNIF